jgi:hypothetical protein
MTAANRRRGQRAEVMVVNYLRAHGFPDARRYLSGDGRQPGDIDAIPGLVIEVKDRANSSWPAWCNQAAEEAKGRAWVVVRRERGTIDVGRWPCQWGPGEPWGSTTTPFRVFLAAFLDDEGVAV